MRRFFELLLATLREIFDEAPYQRFLTRRQLAASANSYALFLEERQAAQERRPRCC